MQPDRQTVITSFDGLARVEDALWNHNRHYYRHALDLVKTTRAHILDIGCGGGDFLALGAARGLSCTGIDFSPGMIEKAKNSPEMADCRFLCGDAYELLPQFPAHAFDAAFSFAAMHHMDYETLLPLLARCVRPGGFFCVVDIRKSGTPADYLLDALAIPPNLVKKRLLHRGAGETEAARRAWEEHGKLDTYHTLGEVRAALNKAGYRYRLRRLLYFRYLLVVEF